jgi:hypothetical protein
MIIGMIPLVIEGGAGANGNRALALGVIGGMSVGTIALLFVVPAFGFSGACFANPAAWVMADLFLFPCYFRIMRTARQRLMPDSAEDESKKVIRLRRAA